MRIKVMAALIAASLLAGCAAIDKTGVGGRVGPMNSGIADYRNEATLLNIVRASRHDPLNFVAIANVTGHNTLNMGVPVIAIPPMGGTTVTVGQGTDQYNASNDFNVNVVDDPASYVALHTPVDPATMAFFYQEGMPPDLLTILFVHHVRIRGRGIDRSFYSNGISSKDTGSALQILQTFTSLAEYGLTFRVQAGSVPGLQKRPRSQICFDPNVIRSIGGIKPLSLRSIIAGRPTESALPALSTCDDKTTWSKAAPPDASAATSIACQSGPCIKAAAAKSEEPTSFYSVKDPYEDLQIEIYTRSVWGMYQFLGGLLAEQHNNGLAVSLLEGGLGTNPIILDVKAERSEACAARATYDGITYCVPRDAANTMFIFSVLHELSGLYTNSQPTQPANSSTVRITP